MLLSLRQNGLTSLFKEVRVFRVSPLPNLRGDQDDSTMSPTAGAVHWQVIVARSLVAF